MAEKIVGLISCLLCAVPFLIIGIFEKNSKEPITFWSGDKTLKSKVKDVTAYNLEMGMLYQKCCRTPAQYVLPFAEPSTGQPMYVY